MYVYHMTIIIYIQHSATFRHASIITFAVEAQGVQVFRSPTAPEPVPVSGNVVHETTAERNCREQC